MFRSETWSTKKAPNLACLQKCFDAHADDKDNRISHDDLALYVEMVNHHLRKLELFIFSFQSEPEEVA